jgi:hypothetical protein
MDVLSQNFLGPEDDLCGRERYRAAPVEPQPWKERNFGLLTTEEFIAAITQHIRPKSYQMVRHCRWYSNRARGEHKKRGMLRPGDEPEGGRSDDVTVLDLSDHDPPRLTSKTWRQLIHYLLNGGCVGLAFVILERGIRNASATP